MFSISTILIWFLVTGGLLRLSVMTFKGIKWLFEPSITPEMLQSALAASEANAKKEFKRKK